MADESIFDMEDIAHHLDSAVIEVFEMMLGSASIPVVPEAEMIATISASIRLFGTNDIECRLCGTDHTAKIMAEALVGSLDEDAEAMIADSFGELCNMVAGNWKNKLAPQHNFRSLTTPAISRALLAEYPDASAGVFTRFYRFEDHVFGIQLAAVVPNTILESAGTPPEISPAV